MVLLEIGCSKKWLMDQRHRGITSERGGRRITSGGRRFTSPSHFPGTFNVHFSDHRCKMLIKNIHLENRIWIQVQPQEEATSPSFSLSLTQREGQGMREKGMREGGGGGDGGGEGETKYCNPRYACAPIVNNGCCTYHLTTTHA